MVGAGIVMLANIAFRQHVGWGLAVLLVPFGALGFTIKYWSRAKHAFLLQVLGSAFFAAGLGVCLLIGVQTSLLSITPHRHRPLAVPVDSPTVPMTADPDPPPAAAVETLTNAGDLRDDEFVGRSLAEVRQLLGRPKADLKQGSRVVLQYDGVEIYSEDGVTVSSQGVSSRPRPTPAPKASPRKEKAR